MCSYNNIALDLLQVNFGTWSVLIKVNGPRAALSNLGTPSFWRMYNVNPIGRMINGDGGTISIPCPLLWASALCLLKLALVLNVYLKIFFAKET